MCSGLFGLLRKAATITALSGLVAGGAVALTSAPAAATGVQAFLWATSWSYVDSAAPHTSFANPSGDAPVGTQVDAAGVRHTTKSYFTFDVSQFEGAAISSATLVATETAAADCTSTATPQAWATGPADNATWDHQPAEHSQLTGVSELRDCPGHVVNWDAMQAVQDALNTGRSTATIALRLPDDQQADPSNWQSYAPRVEMVVQGDHAPTVPTHLTVQNKSCGNEPIYVGKFLPVIGLPMSAVINDRDSSDQVGAQFVFWPVNSPQQRTEIDSISTLPNDAAAGINVPSTDIADNTTYAMQVRATDGTLTGPWSPVCQFITELTPPTAPSVSSTQFPSGNTGLGSGESGTFVVTGGTDPNIVGIDYELDSRGQTYTVTPDANHNATIQYTPSTAGPHTISVWSVDRAGNYSPITNYSFLVAYNSPAVTCTPDTAYIDVPRQCTISPGGSDDVSYVYSFDGGPSTPVAMGPDGTATVTVTPMGPHQGGQILSVQAKLANGNLTNSGAYQVKTLTGPPTVSPNGPETVAGTPTQFTVTATLPGATTATYSIDGVVAPTTVPLGPDGTATFTITPASQAFYELDVYTSNPDGAQSDITPVFWAVDTNAPTVSSDDYPADETSGGIGQPGTFVFSSTVPNVTAYTYVFNGGTPVTVAAGADGTASVVLTPPDDQWQDLTVTSTFANGTTSDEQDYEFTANPVPPTVSCPATVASGQQLTCTLTATQSGVASFAYVWNGGSSTSVPAPADGAATVTVTAPTVTGQYPAYVRLTATSATSGGFASDSGFAQVTVNPGTAG